VAHQVSVHSVDHAVINDGKLKKRMNRWIHGTTINPNHVSHTLGTICVGSDHSIANFDMQEDRVC
jgi:hypothetical protein